MSMMGPRDRLRLALTESGVRARVLRGGTLTVFQSQSGMVFRLVSNLVLTRLLMPEAFGLMAIVAVFVSGLGMFTDIGMRGSVIQSRRGDEPDFLNTIWTLQIGRGVLMWLGACLLAVPAARIYGEPMLLQLLPVASLSVIVGGFQTTNYLTNDRHITLFRTTMVELGSQVVGLIIMVALAFALRSVWALAIGTVISTVIKVGMMNMLIPGIRNRLHLERASVREVVSFGKFIFFTSIAALLIRQSDRAILGAFLPLATFGVYNIGWTIATVPSGMAVALGNKVLFPLYRMRHPLDAGQNRQKIFRARRALVAALLSINAVMAFAGIWLVELLFDPRYALAGPVIVLMTTSMVPVIVAEGTIRAAVAKGDSRSFFIVQVSTALCQVTLVYFGVVYFGILGAVAGVGGASLLTYPLRAMIVNRYRSWDMRGEAAFMVVGLSVNLLACWLHVDEILALIAAS